MIGFISLILALFFSVIAAFTYGMSSLPRLQESQKHKRSGWFYNISFVFVIIASVYLYYLIFSDQYQYRYIYSYSAQDLSVFYKISVFWAGQEGSLLLWALLHSIFGIALKRNLKNHENAYPAVMGVFSLLQLGLLVIVLMQNPFSLLTETPGDGSGLNPLLQNPWMVAHPPVLFLGYAALAVPFSWAVGSLICKDDKSWLKPALGWALFAWAALGMGIFMGGYWAYEVLGWGGYWAWDPVENSSLIPWLITGGFIHFLLVGLRRRSLAVKPAYLTAVFAYSAALYGTFLTRSGVLSDFSTHSFANEGIGSALAALVMIVLIVPLVLLIIRWPSLQEQEDMEQVKTRGFMTVIGGVALCALAIIVLFGTSYPLITMLMGSPQSVASSFYNVVSLPLAACFFLLIILASLLVWKKTDKTISKTEIILVVIGIGAAALGFVYGIYHNVMAVIVLGLAGAALMASIAGLKKGMSKPAVFTHIGFSCLLIGVIISSAASKTEVVTLIEGQEQIVFGKTFAYLGWETMEDGLSYVEKFTMDGEEMNAVTHYDKNGQYSAHEPSVKRGLLYDIYLAPALDQTSINEDYELTKGTSVTIEAEGLELVFNDFGMTSEDSETAGIYALVDVTKNGETEQIELLLEQADDGYQAVEAIAFETYTINLLAVSVNNSKILISVYNMEQGEQVEQVITEISEKPLINFVWLGTIMISIGTIWAAIKRRGPVQRPRNTPNVS